MPKSRQSSVKMIYEQVPVELVKIIARRETNASTAGLASCAVCGNPVKLEQCKINEYGKAVHETCYLTSIKKRRPTGAGAH